MDLLSLIASILKELLNIITKFGDFILGCLKTVLSSFSLIIDTYDLFFNLLKQMPGELFPLFSSIILILFGILLFKILKFLKEFVK